MNYIGLTLNIFVLLFIFMVITRVWIIVAEFVGEAIRGFFAKIWKLVRD